MDRLKFLLILVAFVAFFQGAEHLEAVPHGVRVLGMEFRPHDGHLLLDVCENVLNYGGTRFEYYFVGQLTALAASFEGVRYFTLHIDGHLRELPEGLLIDQKFLQYLQ